MNPQESLNFFEIQLPRARSGFEVARASRNIQLASLNARQMFKCHLMCGLIKWRRNESPVGHFKSALEVVSEASLLLRSWDAALEPSDSLPTSRCALLSCLLDLSFDSNVSDHPERPVDLRLDLLLARAGADAGAQPPSALIAKLAGQKGASLAAECYRTYFDILSAQDRSDSLGTLVKQAEGLFLRRAKDAFFSGADQTEGGGPGNELIVDYRLGVTLKKVGYAGDSIHAWAW